MSFGYRESPIGTDTLKLLVQQTNLIVDDSELESLSRRVSALRENTDRLASLQVNHEEHAPGVTFDPRWR